MKIKEGFSGERSAVLPAMITENLRKEPDTSSLHITDIGYYPHALHHYRQRTEPIDQWILIYCVDGMGFYKTANRRNQVKANQFFIIPPFTPHEYGADEKDPWSIYWIHFRGSLAESYCNGMDGINQVDPSYSSRISERIALFEEMLTATSDWHDLNGIKYACSLLHYFIGSLKYLDRFRSKEKWNPDIIESTIHFMSENLERHLTVNDISEYAGVSASRLSVTFKQATGQSPINYFNMLKIRRACELIDTSDLNINQLCHKVGLSDAYYFSRLFSKVMGLSPSAYRNRPRT